MRTQAAGGGESILRTWPPILRSLLRRLTDHPRDPGHVPALLDAALDIYTSYFRARFWFAMRDSAAALCPPWLNLLPRALLWMGGWRPTAALRLVPAGAEQAVEAVRETVRADVATVEMDMRRVQAEAVAGMATARTAEAEKAAIGSLLAKQRAVVATADQLRMDVVRKVVGELAPLQAVDFLAGVIRMEISMIES